MSSVGTTRISATVRWSCRSWPSTRRAVASVRVAVIGARPRRGRGRRAPCPAAPVASSRPCGVSSASRCPSRRRSRRSQRDRLVHHVARDEQGRAGVGEPVEEVPTGRGAAPGRAPRWARRARAAPATRAARWRARPGSAGRRSRRSRRGGRPRHAGRPPRRRGRPSSSPTPRMRGEVAQVAAHGEVAVHRRRLGDVADARAQRTAQPAGAPEHRDRARRRRSARRRSRA